MDQRFGTAESPAPGRAPQELLDNPDFNQAYRLHLRALEDFHRLAREIAGDALPVVPPPEHVRGVERNFFSTLFLTATRLLVGDSPYLPLYAMVDQCMRAWVTACDNLLDDEYKEVLFFGFPERGRRVRSVLTLLVADRVLNEFLLREFPEPSLLRTAGRVSLSAMLPSALQECREECRPVPVLPPETILSEIHRQKTGALFLAPLALPAALEAPREAALAAARAGLENFGLACQILDDARDMPEDFRSGRHNLLVSLLHQAGQSARLERLRDCADRRWEAWEHFEPTYQAAWALAAERFDASLEALARLGLALGASTRAGIVDYIRGLLGVPPPAGAVRGSARP